MQVAKAPTFQPQALRLRKGRPERCLLLLSDTPLCAVQRKVACSWRTKPLRKSVTRVRLSDNFGSSIWPALKAFILERNPDANDQVLYMCKHCKPLVKTDNLPARCVLNGLETVPMSPELAKLDCLSRQLIQRAKCYQTIVRLGTYTGKVPVYNSLKACRGTMFFLPLPFNKTLATLDQVEQLSTALPDPELYTVVNGRPTKSHVVWRSLVNVDLVRVAVETLRDVNWLYRDVDLRRRGSQTGSTGYQQCHQYHAGESQR